MLSLVTWTENFPQGILQSFPLRIGRAKVAIVGGRIDTGVWDDDAGGF